jgi:hypothetical protein
MTGPRTIVQLESGRAGCDAQVRAVARRLGAHVTVAIDEPHPSPIDAVMLTGPDRRACAERIAAAHPDALVVGFGDAGRLGIVDVHVVTPQFDEHPTASVFRLDYAISPHDVEAHVAPDGLPEGYGLVLVGADAGPWRLDVPGIRAAISTISTIKGCVLVMTSPRTPKPVVRRLRRMRGPMVHVDSVRGRVPDIASAMAGASVVLVTADSVSMASEAVHSGRETALIPMLHEEEDLTVYIDALGADPDYNAMPGRLDRFWDVYAHSGRPTEPRLRTPREPSLDCVVGILERRLRSKKGQ